MLSDEEKKAIEEQYKEGLVNLSNVIEPLINQFKTDYSLDIQQCRLIINYLLMERDFNEDYYDELDKEIEELKQIKCKLDEKNIPIETLLAEFERLEDLEDDLTTVYLNGVYDGEKKVQDKIKAKIEEYKKQQKEEPDAYLCIKVLSSLLEKE